MYSAAGDGWQGLKPCPITIEAFLSNLIPSIHVMAIAQNGGSPNGRNFGSDVITALAFVVGQNQLRNNIYFTVNAVSPDFAGHKPAKTEIAAIRAAHVDIDPYKPGARFDKEAALRSVLIDEPTIVIDSGNGLHAYWVLIEAAPATPENVASIEAVNKALVARYGGDQSAWNVDRVLRVPGTVNWPNEKKRALGRVPCMATVVL